MAGISGWRSLRNRPKSYNSPGDRVLMLCLHGMRVIYLTMGDFHRGQKFLKNMANNWMGSQPGGIVHDIRQKPGWIES